MVRKDKTFHQNLTHFLQILRVVNVKLPTYLLSKILCGNIP